MAANELAPWINSAGEDGFRNSMAEFQGDGSTTKFEFNFAGGYLRQQDVKAYIYDTLSGLTTDIAGQFTWIGPNSIEYKPAIPSTQFLVIYRDTQKTVPLVDFTTNAGFTESNLDLVTKQAVFVAAEMVDRFDSINASSADAVERSFTALTKAEESLAASGNAVTTANGAMSVANAAAADADDAVAVANNAQTVATGIDGKAQTALNNSTAAVETASNAQTVANGIDAKAQTALDNSAQAVISANTAKAASDLAVTTAAGVDGKAQTALDNSTAALSKANTAVQKAGSTMTGPLSVPSGATGSQVPQAQEVVLRSQVAGTVSQVAGVPTGAIFESKITPSGSYIAYADGTLMCFGTVLVPACAFNSGASVAWIFPKHFTSTPFVFHSTLSTASGSNEAATGTIAMNSVFVNRGNDSATFGTWAYREAMLEGVYLQVWAVGRWF